MVSGREKKQLWGIVKGRRRACTNTCTGMLQSWMEKNVEKILDRETRDVYKNT